MSFQAGVLYFDGRSVAPGEAAALCGLVRGDGSGSPYSFQAPGLLLAHSAVPPWSTQSAVVSFDGRLDNRPDLLRRLPDFRESAGGDASLALAVYEKWGAAGLADLIGDWSMAIWDRARRVLVLASDYAGIRPLYYCIHGQRVFWSTRLRLLLNLAQAYEIDETYVAGFLAFTGAPNHTPYRGVYSVPPGGAVHVTADAAKPVRFWRLPVADTIRYQHESEYEDHLRSLFREAMQCRIAPGSRCLAELSGGLDSSSVVAMAADVIRTGEVKPESFTTLTVEHEGSRDTRFYTAMEQFCAFPSIHLQAAEHPFLTPTETGGAIPGFWAALQKRIAQAARQIGATTYLTGKLGDDVMGNWWDDSEQIAGLLRDGRFAGALGQTLAWSKAMQVPAVWLLWRALRSSLPAALGAAPRNRFKGVPETPEDREDSISRALRGHAAAAEAASLFSRDWVHARPERRRHCQTLTQAFELRKLQAPEAFENIDYVYPFAHRPLVTFMLAVPPAIVCAPGEPRRLMRRAFRQLWPPDLQRRRSKDGFGGVFLDSLRPLAEEMRKPGQILQVVERGYVEPASLKRRLDRLAMALTCNEPQLRQIILLEYWLRAQSGGAVDAGRIAPAVLSVTR